MAASALKDKGWFLTDEGIEQCSQNKKDVDSVIKVALDTDLREIGKSWLPEEVNRGKADYVEGPGVLQVQKIRNVSAPKDNEDSQAAPRLMKLVLTDGAITCTAVETEVLKDVGSKTAPGSKIKLRLAADVEHGFLLLNNKNTQYLGGRVDKLAEGWELKKKLAKQERTFGADGGPPPFVPFGHRIDGTMGKGPPRRDNFKSLDASKGEKKAEKKVEDVEFEQQRMATIAEAMQAKEDTQAKKFGGGQNKMLSDQDVAKIVSMGFSAEAATNALRSNNGNLQQALDYLLSDRPGPMGRGRNGPGDYDRRGKGENLRQLDDGRGRGRRNRRDEDGEPRGGPGRRGRDQEEGGDAASTKPSAPATLFDFLETKIPAKEKKGNRTNQNNSGQNESSRMSESSRQQFSNNRESDQSRSSSAALSDTAANKDFNRPKSVQVSQNSVPPRFANRSKQDSNQSYGRNKGRSFDDRSPRENNVPKSAPSDNRSQSNRFNDNRTSYSDRSDRNRNYSDRNGDKDFKGPKETGRQNSRNSDYSDRNGDNFSRGGNNTGKRNDQSSYDNRTPSRDELTEDTSSNQQRNKSQYNSQKQSSDPRRETGSSARDDNRSRNKNNTMENQSRSGNTSQSQQNYRNEQGDRSYGVNGGNYGNQRQSGHYGNNQQAAGQYQQQPDYRYPEVPTTPGLKRGDKVMAKYWEDGQFYEATVEGLAPNLPTCVVTFQSYGNTEEVFLTDIRPIVRSQMMSQPDFSVPPPQIFFSGGPPPAMTQGVEECIQGISSMEFRRGGGGARYQRKDPSRPPQQLYQPPGQRR